MSRGWVLGTSEFRAELAEEHRHAGAALEAGESEAGEVRSELLARRLGKLLCAVGRTQAQAKKDPKGAPWKVALASEMKRTTTATNRWLAEQLHMGNPFSVSRLVSASQRDSSKIDPWLQKMSHVKA